ncbi:HAD-IIIA family hydrolase [Alphaproteobacteria bacterium]|nr:HAD-IIIA family hydrolase [Alphaproteobacteria bacterium]
MLLFHSVPIKCVILDRDGVINRDLPSSVRSIKEFEMLPGVPEAIAALNQKGVSVALATNQAVVGRDELSHEDLDLIHQHMEEQLLQHQAHLDKIFSCTSCDDNHPDRKPRPGMLLKAMDFFKVGPEHTLFIGDALRDLTAAQRAGCHFSLVRTGKGLKSEAENAHLFRENQVLDDLRAVVASLGA